MFFFGGGASSLPNQALDEGPLKMLKSLAGFRSRPNLSTAFTKAVSCRLTSELFFGGRKIPSLVAENSTNPSFEKYVEVKLDHATPSLGVDFF